MSTNLLKSVLVQSLWNLLGWRTKRKIIVFESDDWGSIRMPSKETYTELLKLGIRVDENPYDRYDAIETEADFSRLFEVLSKFKDKSGKHPIITANTLVANPDFAQIRNSFFEEYHYELFTTTYSKYSSQSNTFSALKQGISERFFYPQFHGREHLNVTRWMKALQDGVAEVKLAFDMNLYCTNFPQLHGESRTYLQAFGLENYADIEYQKTVIEDGLKIFNQTFGFNSRSFIAPKYTWHYDLDPVLLENGIRYFQGKGYRKIPMHNKNTIMRYYMGKRNALNQIYLRRNCLFEPSFYERAWVDSCLREISNSFLLLKPAVIETHRLNYIGSIVPDNRNNNLVLLADLLRKIIDTWPDVEFLNSEELGDLVSESNVPN